MTLAVSVERIARLAGTEPRLAEEQAVSLIEDEQTFVARQRYIRDIVYGLLPQLLHTDYGSALARACLKGVPEGDERKQLIEEIVSYVIPKLPERDGSRLFGVCFMQTPENERGALIEHYVKNNPSRPLIAGMDTMHLNGRNWSRRSLGETVDGYAVNAFISRAGTVILTGGCFMGAPEALIERYQNRPERQRDVQYPIAERLAELSASRGFRWASTRNAVEGVAEAAVKLRDPKLAAC